MQINKKLITTTLTALLLLSMLAAAAPAFAAPGYAIQVDSLTPPSPGTVGTAVVVAGSVASPGGSIQVYWDSLAGALLNTTSANGLGAFTVPVKIPDATAGNHYLIVIDISTGTTIGALFVVTPKISLSPTSGIPGDSVTVTGTGFGAQKNINVTFGGVDVTPVALQVSSVTGNITLVFIVPVVPYAPYPVVASDNATVPNVAPAVTFTVSAAITLSPSSGPPGTIVTVTGRGFVAAQWVSLAVTAPPGAGIPSPIANLTVLRTAAGGTFSGTFVVPSVTAGAKTITATEGTWLGTATFTVKGVTSLTTSPTSAAPGATVTVTGTNFTAIAGTAVTVKFATFTVGTFTTNSTGGFSGSVTIPSLPTGPYTLQAVDANVLNATIPTFYIAITNLFASASVGPTGTVLTLTSFGFTVGTLANVTFGVYQVLTFVTDASLQAGTAQFKVPTVPTGTYTITVTDDVFFTASTAFTVNATSTLVVSPSGAPAALTNVDLRVTNFAAGATVAFYLTNSTYSALLVAAPKAPFVALVTNGNGALNATFTVPALALGAYTIVANETTFTMYNATAAFTIGTATLTIAPRATSYVQGDIVSFSIQSTFDTDMAITIADPQGTPAVLYVDSTWLTQIGSLWILPYANDLNQSFYGTFGWGTFVIPNDAPTGTWTWNATVVGTTTVPSGTFTVAVSSTAMLNAINQTVTQTNSTVNTINTNLGLVNATIVSINGTVATINTNVGTISVNLNDIGANVTSIKGTVATIQTNVGTIQTSLTAINATIVTINGNTATVSTSIGSLTTSVSSLSSSISSISNGVGSIQTSLGTVTATLSGIDAVIGYVANDTTNIVTSLGTITTSLASIGTTVTSISGNVATIQTDLGTLSGTVTSVTNSGIATIQTSLGTMQIDISGLTTSASTLQSDLGSLQSDVTATKDNTASLSPLIIVAIVLALVAAIAAIASIVLMRRKIAG